MHGNHLDRARLELAAWAEWTLHGQHITSAIGYAPETVEARLIRFGAISSSTPGPVVPLSFRGCEQYKTLRAVQALPFDLAWALCLKYLWTSTGNPQRPRVTDNLRAARWATDTGKRHRGFFEALEKAEWCIAGTLL